MGEPAVDMSGQEKTEEPPCDVGDIISNLIYEARTRSSEHERVFGRVYDLYMGHVLNRYQGGHKIDALKGVIRAVDATSLRVKGSSRQRTNTIEIDMAADVGVKHRDKLEYFCDEMRGQELGLQNAGVLANAYWIIDCLPPQFDRMRKYGNPYGQVNEETKMRFPKKST